MHRINTSTASSGKFIDGNANQGIKGTQVDSSWLNSVQEEISKTIEDAGVTLDSENDNQLTGAIRKLVASSLVTYDLSSTLASTTNWTNAGNKVDIKTGNLIDITLGLFVSTPANDILIVKTKIDGDKRASFDLSVKGFQSKRLTFYAGKDINDYFAEYTFVSGNQGATPTLYINGFISKF